MQKASNHNGNHMYLQYNETKTALIVHDFSFLTNLYAKSERDQDTYIVYARKYHIKGEVLGAQS